MNRRNFSQCIAASMLGMKTLRSMPSLENQPADRCLGLLIGSLLGDAMGGPLEFANAEKRSGNVVSARQWDPPRRLDKQTISEISGNARMMGYEDVRPETAAYGPWLENAPAGTITDDSRWKIILLRAIQLADGNSETFSKLHIAKAILDFRPKTNREPDGKTKKLVDEGLREYRFAADWLLGKRDKNVALPPDRLWAGVANCSGQMLLLPLAVRYAGQPRQAYLKAFELDFIDSAAAKDIAAIIVAALASIIGENSEQLSVKQRWESIHNTMATLDPLKYKAVPFVGRPLDKWLTLVDSIVERADGRPAVAYRLLETDAKPVFFWDAHFTLVVALTLLKLCKYDPMCSLSLAIDFGHDTDSYAQLIGAFVGAVHGPNVFPKEMREKLARRLKEDYGENVELWVAELRLKKAHSEK